MLGKAPQHGLHIGGIGEYAAPGPAGRLGHVDEVGGRQRALALAPEQIPDDGAQTPDRELEAMLTPRFDLVERDPFQELAPAQFALERFRVRPPELEREPVREDVERTPFEFPR